MNRIEDFSSVKSHPAPSQANGPNKSAFTETTIFRLGLNLSFSADIKSPYLLLKRSLLRTFSSKSTKSEIV